MHVTTSRHKAPGVYAHAERYEGTRCDAVHNQVPDAAGLDDGAGVLLTGELSRREPTSDRRAARGDGRRVHGVATAAALGVESLERTVPVGLVLSIVCTMQPPLSNSPFDHSGRGRRRIFHRRRQPEPLAHLHEEGLGFGAPLRRLDLEQAGVSEARVPAGVDRRRGEVDPVNHELAHYTGQADMAQAIDDAYLAAVRSGDVETATRQFGEAVRMAHEAGDTYKLQGLAAVVDIEDAAPPGTVRLSSMWTRSTTSRWRPAR